MKIPPFLNKLQFEFHPTFKIFPGLRLDHSSISFPITRFTPPGTDSLINKDVVIQLPISEGGLHDFEISWEFKSAKRVSL